MRCYQCKQVGHSASCCAIQDPSKEAREQVDQETVNSIPEQNVLTMSINSTSSYTLSCTVNRTPIPFHVYTGVGVKSEV